MDLTQRVARRAFAAAALASVAALATACGSSSSTTASGNAAPAAPDSTASATTPAASATTPAASATTPAASSGPGPCPTSSLRLKMGATQGAAGSVYTTIVFTNVSNATCTLYGYPRVSLTTGKPGTQIGKAAKENPATPPRPPPRADERAAAAGDRDRAELPGAQGRPKNPGLPAGLPAEPDQAGLHPAQDAGVRQAHQPRDRGRGQARVGQRVRHGLAGG